jgi:hypothetical protein
MKSISDMSDDELVKAYKETKKLAGLKSVLQSALKVLK